MAGGGGKATPFDEYMKFAEDESNKPKFKRDKQGLMRREDHKFEFDCPECNANNPWDEGFGDGSEVQCHYCGCDLKVTFLDTGKLKLKLI